MNSRVTSASDLPFLAQPYRPLYNPFTAKPVLVHQYVHVVKRRPNQPERVSRLTTHTRRNTYDNHVFAERPLLGSLLFDNNDSDARDHCAAERSSYHPGIPTTAPRSIRCTYEFSAKTNVLYNSIPLLAPPRNLHGHRLRRNPHLLPPESRSLGAREANRAALRPRLLAAVDGVSGCGAEQLHQDCVEVFETTGVGAEWDGDAGGKFA